MKIFTGTTGTTATIMITVMLGAIGIGLVTPVLPDLVRDVTHRDDLGWRFGAFIGLYALMQFVFSPMLGVLSDRIGRKPVLLLSLLGAVLDYLVMAFAPNLALLFIGRAIAGVTGANLAVATAALTDITPRAQRTQRFGLLNAFIGIGFIAGPALGGLLGEISVRAPFYAAAALNGATLLLALLFLRETRAKQPGATAPDDTHGHSLNPLHALRWAGSFPALVPLMVAFGILCLVGEVGGTIWVLYGTHKFAWDSFTVGVSLTLFGIFHALVQAFLVGPVSARWGERRTFIIGILTDGAAFMLIAFATEGWMGFALVPLFTLGGVAMPALQSLATTQVSEDQQGRIQGVLTSVMSLATIFGPVGISALYFATVDIFPGAVWIVGALMYFGCLPSLSRMDARAGRNPTYAA